MIPLDYVNRMVSPGQKRHGVPRGGVLQIHITRVCDLACFGCTQGSNLGGKPVLIPVDEFEKACQSLEGYWGIVGIFGGNPALHPKFETICEILCKYFPDKSQRGLWCNHPRGNGKIMREVFDPAHSNLNVHMSQEAHDEFLRDWPELVNYPSRFFGLHRESHHSPPFVAMLDVVPDAKKRWELISNCDINRHWSAMVCYVPGKGLRAFFCELAGGQAMLHSNNPNWPDTGLPAEPGWWRKPMADFANQVEYNCHRCGIPLRRVGQLATQGVYEEVSATHKDIYNPKTAGREVRIVEQDNGDHLALVTDYIGNSSR